MENLQQLSVEISKFPNVKLLEIEPLNRRQCTNLLDNFQNGVQAMQKIHYDFQEDVFDQAMKDMLRIMRKSRDVVEECCTKNWYQVVMMQINNKELFRELLWDFECSFHLMCDILRHSLPSREDEISAFEMLVIFNPTSLDEVEEDQNSICGKLSEHLNLCKVASCKDCTLAQYLLRRGRGLLEVGGGDLDSIPFPNEYPYPVYKNPPSPLGTYGFGYVYPTQWLGLDTVTKVILVNDFDHERIVWKEACILEGLSHPNIIKFFCCGLRIERDKFGIDDKIFELVMEQGEMNLSHFLEQQDLLIEEDAIELMLQIARGVCYLHDMKVAHRDLKPCNVVVTSKSISKARNLENVQLKLVDFGISKLELSNSQTMPNNGSVHGTSVYMAPEAFVRRRLGIDAFKTDVFSFGMMCSEILTTKNHFDKFSIRDYVISILKGERPKLPETCSSGLKSLIHECWSLDPTERPTFLDICQSLTKLKNEIIVKAFFDVGEPKRVIKFTSHVDSKTNQEQWWTTLKLWKFLGGLWFLTISWQMFDIFNQWLSCILRKIWELISITSLPCDREGSNIAISNPMLCEVNKNANQYLKFIGLDRKILEMEKKLQHVSALGIIGIGGIGKSTLAKALSGHISHRFDVTCFLGDFTEERCNILLQYKSRPLNVHAQTKTLREGQEILEQLQKTQKVFIVLDNIGNSSQLDKLLGPHIFEDVNGSRLIVSSRDWTSLKGHVPILGRINMEVLDEDQSRELFSMHAFTTNEPCLPYLKYVFEKIVSTCNGLPLSLEVIGSTLHGEKSLRVWERTMYRLLRARHDITADEEIWWTLRATFDELYDKEKYMFLDIACFFCKDLWRDGIGLTKESLYRIYDDDVNNLQQTFESLKDKSFLKVDDDDVINIHDQLRDMGRMIVDMEYHGTRIWNLCSATFTAYHNQKGLKFVEGLSFKTIEQHSKNAPNIHLNAMNNLQLLNVQNCENVDLLFAIMRQTTQLKWLSISFPSHCDEFSLQQESSMQNIWDFAHDNLHQMHVLEICNSKINRSISLDSLQLIPLKQLTLYNCDTFEEFPNGLTKLEALEELNIIRCKTLKNIPKGLGNLICLVKLQLFGCEALEEFPSRVSTLKTLKELHFQGCKSLKQIPEGFEGLTSLKKLYMGDCEALEEFPSGVGTLVALEELDFHGCKSLKLIPEGFKGLINLKKLYMGDCEALEEFPSGVCTLIALEELYFYQCKSLKLIREGFEGLTCLEKLSMWGCEALEEFPFGVHTLVALEELDFQGWKSLETLPEGFHGLTWLNKLYMGDCEALEEFPSGVGTLMALEELDFQGCKSLMIIPEGFQGLTCLKELYMGDCEALQEFPSGIGTLVALKELDFHGCRSLTTIPKGFQGLTCLKKLYMGVCEALQELPSGVSTLATLEKLDFHGCMSLKIISEGFIGLICLKKLYMWDCEALEEFPSGVGTLVALEELDFHGCKSLNLVPEGFKGLICLKKLYMWDCEALQEFPSGVATLVTLEKLDFHGCMSLKIISEGFKGLMCLKKLYMWDCEALEEFPSGVATLVALQELDLHGCKSLKLVPEGFKGLICLKELYMWDCEALEEFPSGVGTLVALEELDFHGCKSLKFIHEGFKGLICLKKLYMWDCEALEEFPSGVSTLVALEEFDFHGCRSLKLIPEGFKGLINLKKLYIRDCEALEEFPMGVCTLVALEELNFQGCKSLKIIPEVFHGLTCLTKLHMGGCEALQEFPSGISTLEVLEELDFRECKSLMIIPEGLEGLTCLKKLYMGGCEALEEFPCGVSSLVALEELDLHGCKSLKLIPEGFEGLTSLKKLYMGGCEALEEFPSGVCTLVALEELYFYQCKSLKLIPQGFEGLTCLKEIVMWDCAALEEFPSGIGTLVALEELDLHGCKSLKVIPEGFKGLTCLKKLIMWDCEALEEFPLGICTLKALEELDFHGCKSVSNIPEGLWGLKSLKRLSMWDCEALEEFPLGVSTLQVLEDLDFHGCNSLTNTPEGYTRWAKMKEVEELANEFGDLTFCIEGPNEKDELMRKNYAINDLNALEEQYIGESSNDLDSSVNLSPPHQQVNIQELEIVGRKLFVFHCTLNFLILIGGRLLGHSMATILFSLIIKEVLKITFKATLFSTITLSMMEITVFGLLNLIPYWIHKRHHNDLCIEECGGYLFCERVGLCMSMIYVQVCSLWVWSLVCLCHQLSNPHIWSIVSLSFIWFFVVLLELNKIEWKYKLWSMLKFVFQDKAYKLADYIREVVPDLAPCNPFADVVNSQDVDKFITPQGHGLDNLWLSMHCEEHVWKEDIRNHIEKYNHLKQRVLYPIKAGQRRIFLIGSGWVEVGVLEDDNFRFKSSTRGRTIQYFYATLSSQQCSTLLALLAMWEDSPNLGVLENFVQRGDGIYCHCMDLQSMVEALFECTNFTVVMLQKPIKFHIGAKCSREHSPTYLIAFIAQVLTVVGTYFQLKDNYSNVAIVLTSLAILAMMGAITSPSILLLEKILVYNVLWCFRLGSQRLLWLYLQLKIRNCFLAFCDDFKPVLHRANVEAELITLFNCTHGSLTGDFDRPDWSEVEADQTPYVANAIAKTNVLTSKSGEILEYRQGLDYRTFDLKCQRTVYAESKYDGDVLETQLKIDGEGFEEYIWSEDSYFLFVYLMIKWSQREFGVIRSSRHLMYRRYYHVFNVHELARHIAKHKLKKYKKLLDESVDVMTRRTVPKENAKLDPANKGEMVAGYHV